MSEQEDGSFIEIVNQHDFEDKGYGWIMLWVNIGDSKITLSTLKISVTNAEN